VVINRFPARAFGEPLPEDLAQKAGPPKEETCHICGHTRRVGVAQDLMTDGRDILAIWRAGGWTLMSVDSRCVEKAFLWLWE
jgi:hypothetical protein